MDKQKLAISYLIGAYFVIEQLQIRKIIVAQIKYQSSVCGPNNAKGFERATIGSHKNRQKYLFLDSNKINATCKSSRDLPLLSIVYSIFKK